MLTEPGRAQLGFLQNKNIDAFRQISNILNVVHEASSDAQVVASLPLSSCTCNVQCLASLDTFLLIAMQHRVPDLHRASALAYLGYLGVAFAN